MATAGQYIAKQADQLIRELGDHFGSRLRTGRAAREQFSCDESVHIPVLPDAVVAVVDTDEVCRVVAACNRWKVPLVAYGTGTALEGQAIAVCGGVTLDMSAMNKVLEVHQEDLDAVVQPHVTRRQLNDHLKDSGLFFRWTLEPMPHWGVWLQPGPQEPIPCATVRCARMCYPCRWCWLMVVLYRPHGGPENRRLAMI